MATKKTSQPRERRGAAKSRSDRDRGLGPSGSAARANSARTGKGTTGAKPVARRKVQSRATLTPPVAPSSPVAPRVARRKRDGASKPIPVHILSDSTGNLANHMLTAFLTQFPAEAFETYHHHFLSTDQKLREALAKISELRGIVFHALVSPLGKQIVRDHCTRERMEQCDLTGHFVQFIADATGIRPQPDVRKLHRTHSAGYSQRMKALEFTLEHDDGLGLETLHEADIVLTGVSRTSKTPTSIYLAQQGFRVANVSLAIAVGPPPELLALRERVVGLTIEQSSLVEIRTNRNTSWRMGDTSYNDPEYVNREILWSRRLFRDQGWPILNVTDQAIEETAVKVTDLLGLKLPTQA